MKKLFLKLYKMLIKILCFLPMKNIIVFESNPDYACNTYPVFKYIKEHCQEYKCVWMVNEGIEKHPLADEIVYINGKGFKNKIKKIYICLLAKAFVSCNRYQKKYREDQISLFLTHGSKTKKTRGIYEMGDKVDYILVQSHFFDDIICYEYNAKPEQLLYLGFPRNDYFYQELGLDAEKLELPKDSQYVIWLPTFRKTIGGTDKETAQTNIGIPLIYSVDALQKINDYLKEKNLYIIYKPHPAQNIALLKATSLSNIKIINDKFLSERGLQLAQVLAGSSALLTDYSSVFFDYILLDKPIGTTTDDIDAWKESRGFAFDLDAMYDKSTERLPDLDSLIGFLDKTLSGVDEKRDGRCEVRDLTNTYFDGDSSKRVVDFLMEKINKK